MRNLKYSEAIFESFYQLLEKDSDVVIIGQGLWSPWYVGATMTDLEKKFGKDRILDTPVSENATTGVAIGAAMTGKKPIVVHPRMDFMLLAMDPIINQASNWSYLFEGAVNVPVVIRSIINRGGEQGAQHSQALQSFFMHVPGIKVVMPATPADAKGLMISAVNDGNPVMFIDDRWCYDRSGPVAEKMQPIPLGEGEIIRSGEDVTVVATSYLVNEAEICAQEMDREGISIEVINLRTIKPWDREIVIKSVMKTGRLIIADTGWIQGGIAAEISSHISGNMFSKLKSPIIRVGLPNIPAPCSRTLEEVYYPKSNTIKKAIEVAISNSAIPHEEITTKLVPGAINF